MSMATAKKRGCCLGEVYVSYPGTYSGKSAKVYKSVDGSLVRNFPAFDVMNCLTLDADNNVYIAGNRTNYEDYPDTLAFSCGIRKYDKYGTFIWGYDTSNSKDVGAYDITVDPAGYIYVATRNSQAGGNYLYKLDNDGVLVWSINIDVRKVTVGSDGKIYVECSGTRIYNTNGSLIRTISNIHYPSNDSDGNIYGVDPTHYLIKYDSVGNVIWISTDRTPFYESDVVVDSDGFIYVSSNQNGIQKWDSDGNLIWWRTSRSVHKMHITNKNVVYYKGSNVVRIDDDGNEVLIIYGGNPTDIAVTPDLCL